MNPLNRFFTPSPARPAWPLLLAALVAGALEWLALWRSRGADRRAQQLITRG